MSCCEEDQDQDQDQETETRHSKNEILKTSKQDFLFQKTSFGFGFRLILIIKTERKRENKIDTKRESEEKRHTQYKSKVKKYIHAERQKKLTFCLFCSEEFSIEEFHDDIS